MADIENLVSVGGESVEHACEHETRENSPGIAVLDRLAVERACKWEHLWVRDDIARDDAGSEGGSVV